jgi:hypothetical protein
MCNTKKRFPVVRHHHRCGGDVLESTLDSSRYSRDSCGACCRSGAVQEDDDGYLRHVAFGVLNIPAVRSDAVVLAAALLQCLQCLLEFCVIPIWRVCPAPPGSYGRKLTPLFHEFGAGVSGNPVLLLGSVMFTVAGSTCADRQVSVSCMAQVQFVACHRCVDAALSQVWLSRCIWAPLRAAGGLCCAGNVIVCVCNIVR